MPTVRSRQNSKSQKPNAQIGWMTWTIFERKKLKLSQGPRPLFFALEYANDWPVH